MIGLPTETTSDLDGILDLLKWACNLSKIKGKKPLDITCTISTFVPKAFTPFQWFSQNKTSEFEEKINYLKSKVREYRLRTVKLNYTDPKIALLEAVLSRGDRRMSKLIYNAYKKGAKFDAWDECLDIGRWHEAGKEIGLDLHYEATKYREVGSISPWDLIDTGLLSKFLIEEYNKAVKVVETSPCTENTCHACGVCFELGVLNIVTEDKSKNNKFVKIIETGNVIPAKAGIQKNKPEKWIPGQAGNDTCAPIQAKPKTFLPFKTVQKVEIVHTKKSDLRFISHLDVQRLFERALRRAEVPISYTEGFNPRPKMQWLMPLPIYYESNYELMYLELSEHVSDLQLQVILNKQLPSEFQLLSVKTIDLKQELPKIENVKLLYKALTCDPTLWEKYTCESKTVINSFLEQSSLIQKVFKKSKDKESLLEKELDIRSLVERIEILSTLPLELELVLVGNSRAEIVLNYLTRKVFQSENMQSDFPEWQLNWKVTKEKVLVGV